MDGNYPLRFASLFMALGALLASSGCTVPVTVTLEPHGSATQGCGTTTEGIATRAVDGDTIAVKLPGGREETVRILGIDTPETEDHGNWGNEYEGITDPSYLTSWGHSASAYTGTLVTGRTVMLTTDCQAGDRDRYGRLLAYVTVDGADVGAALLSGGYARVYTEESFTKRPSYLLIQSQAQRAGAGLWIAAKTPEVSQKTLVSIASVQYDAPGDDRENLNGEYIVIASVEPVNLSGWIIADNSGTVYTFGDVTVHPDHPLTLHIGSGTPSETRLYWNLSAPLLGNDADAVTLRDPDGKAIATFRWGT